MTQEEAKELKPIFDILPDHYYLAQWYVGGGNIANYHDLLALAWRTPDGQWHARVRYRLYLDDNLGPESNDVKHVYNIRPPADATEDQVYQKMNEVMENWAAISGADLHVIEGRCLGDEFIEKLMLVQRKWMHHIEVEDEK